MALDETCCLEKKREKKINEVLRLNWKSSFTQPASACPVHSLVWARLWNSPTVSPPPTGQLSWPLPAFQQCFSQLFLDRVDGFLPLQSLTGVYSSEAWASKKTMVIIFGHRRMKVAAFTEVLSLFETGRYPLSEYNNPQHLRVVSFLCCIKLFLSFGLSGNIC